MKNNNNTKCESCAFYCNCDFCLQRNEYIDNLSSCESFASGKIIRKRYEGYVKNENSQKVGYEESEDVTWFFATIKD